MIFAMKINFKNSFYFFVFLTTLFLGCKKEVVLIEPDPLGHARVLNTDIPVPFARLAYLKSNEDGFMGIETFTVLKRDTADANGNFTIDYSIDADYIAARYDSVIYDYSYQQDYLDLKDLSRKNNVASIPGYGWVGVTCLDIPPLNPEVTSAIWIRGNIEYLTLSETNPVLKKSGTRSDVSIEYYLYSGNSIIFSGSESVKTCFNDTTYVVIKY